MKVERKDDEEIEMLLGQIPHATSLPFLRHECDNNGDGCRFIRGDAWNGSLHVCGYSSQQDVVGGDKLFNKESVAGYVCVSPVAPSEGSSSSFLSGSDSTNAIDELQLSERFRAMGIANEEDNWYGSLIGSNRVDVVTNGSLDDYKVHAYRDSNISSRSGDSVANLAMEEEERRLLMLRLRQHYQMGKMYGYNRSNALLPCLVHDADLMGLSWKEGKKQATEDIFSMCSPVGTLVPSGLEFNQGVGVPDFPSSAYRVQSHLQPNGLDYRGNESVVSSFGQSPSASQPKPSLRIDHSRSSPRCCLPVHPSAWTPQACPLVNTPGHLYGYECEGSFILQEKDLPDVTRRHDRGFPSYGGNGYLSAKNGHFNYAVGINPRIYSSPVVPVKTCSLTRSPGCMYFMAKDQHGCRFLQRKFDEGNPRDVQMIFNEIIHDIVELMLNPFGNYLVQKLLEVCNEGQRMQILLVITQRPGELVDISVDTHGTRVVQKLIETVRTQQQISLLLSALEPGFLDLIKDPNGNHVVQRCLQCFSSEDNKFIFYAAAKCCVHLATHRHGCCVLQRCIDHSTGEYREKLVSEISANGLLLAQDPYGNYAVQYILRLKIPSASATLVSQFEGNYVHLSQQKFSSNVVETCLEMFGEETRSRIIRELLSTSHFGKLLQDPYANYVIQSALEVSKGPLHASLLDAIRPHTAILRSNPHCKKIFSQAVFKK